MDSTEFYYIRGMKSCESESFYYIAQLLRLKTAAGESDIQKVTISKWVLPS